MQMKYHFLLPWGPHRSSSCRSTKSNLLWSHKEANEITVFIDWLKKKKNHTSSDNQKSGPERNKGMIKIWAWSISENKFVIPSLVPTSPAQHFCCVFWMGWRGAKGKDKKTEKRRQQTTCFRCFSAEVPELTRWRANPRRNGHTLIKHRHLVVREWSQAIGITRTHTTEICCAKGSPSITHRKETLTYHEKNKTYIGSLCPITGTIN